jgi:hypothetical protein
MSKRGGVWLPIVSLIAKLKELFVWLQFNVELFRMVGWIAGNSSQATKNYAVHV